MPVAVTEYPFKFRISYLTLFTRTRRLQIYAGKLGEEAGEFVLPALDERSEGYLLRTLPVQSRVRLDEDSGKPLLRYELQRFPRYYIEMANGNFEDYKAKFSGKTRSTIQRKLRKFTDYTGGALRWQTYRTPSEIAEFWGFARAISAKTYQERLLDAGLPDDPGYRREAEQWAARDSLRAYLLFDRDRPVSYLFCPVRDGVIDYAFLGYDPEYQRLSVGTVLQWLALEALFGEQRFRYFDFTEGESEHKRLFATHHVECAHVALLRPTLANRLLVASHAIFNRAIEGLRSWLERHQLKSRIQRWLRAAKT